MRRTTSRLRRKGHRKVDATSERRPAKKRKHRRATKLSEALVLVGGIVACAFLNVLGGTIFMVLANRSSPDVSPEGSEADELPEHIVVDPLAFQRFSRNAPACHPISADEVEFTLVSQLSLDRIWMMEHHCQRWGGNSHMSIAILTNETRQQTLARLESLGCDLDSITLQTMRLEPSFSTDYPVNRLRNLAMSAVETSHVMLVDVDFWEARNLRDLLYLPEVVDALVNDSKLALVIPAFQLIRQCREYRDCREKNVPRMPFSKNDMVELMLGRKGSPFDPTNRGGHFSTLYLPWPDQEDGELLDLPCIRSNRYEPYMAFRYCQDLPPFQEAFTGYGKNKMTMVMQMRRSGYQFSQLGGSFVVHYPHLDSSSRREWNHGPDAVKAMVGPDGRRYQKRPVDVEGANWTAYKRGQVDAIFVQFRNWLKEAVPDESRVPMCDNAEDDDARLWISRSA